MKDKGTQVEKKKAKKPNQTHVKYALAHILLSIFPQVIIIVIPTPFLSHAETLAQSDTFHVYTPKPSALYSSSSLSTILSSFSS